MVEGWETGGATQYEFSLSVEQLEGIGLLKEIKWEMEKTEREGAIEIIQKEKLINFNMFEKRNNKEMKLSY